MRFNCPKEEPRSISSRACLLQVYPEGNQSNNNQFFAAATGTVTAIDGLKASGRALLSIFPLPGTGITRKVPTEFRASLSFDNLAQVTITTPSGEVKTQELLTGADIVVQAGLEQVPCVFPWVRECKAKKGRGLKRDCEAAFCT